MSPLYEHTDGFIIRDILTTMEHHPQTYCLNTLKGLLDLKNLAVEISAKRVKSLRGTFQQAKLTGFCLASGWAEQHKGIENSDDLLPELVLLATVMESSDFAQVNLKNKNYTKCLELCVVHGFENGILLGRAAAKEFTIRHKKMPYITTEFLHLFLELHRSESQEKTQLSFVTRHKNRLFTQVRRNKKINTI